MAYSFEVCHAFGDVFLSDDKKGCALLLLPEQKRLTPRSVLWNIGLIRSAVGLGNLKKVVERESKIRKLHPKEPIYYLWFIGVDPDAQHAGTGTGLLREVIGKSKEINRPVYLETSVPQNLYWYEKMGFEIYNELNFGYRLFFLKLCQHR